MRVKQITKPLALFSASAMLFAASGCSDTSWSYKTSQKALSNGAWIYYTFSAMNDAASKIEEESGTAVDLAEDGLSDLMQRLVAGGVGLLGQKPAALDVVAGVHDPPLRKVQTRFSVRPHILQLLRLKKLCGKTDGSDPRGAPP